MVLLMQSIAAFSQPAIKSMLRLPDTGQTRSYTTTYGEDADYERFLPGYIDHGDGTITDTVTGLMWQKYDGGEMRYETAVSYCDSLQLAGYNDWRLPNSHELFSILNLDHVNPAIDTNFFKSNGAEYWWSNQQQFNDTNKIWVTNAGGGVGNHPRSETISAGGTKRFHTRAVRYPGSPQIISQRWVSVGTNLIYDSVTALVWWGMPFTAQSWEQALTVADTAAMAGYHNWRLPNIRELQSLNVENRGNPSVNTSLFPSVNTGHYWSSTSLPNQTDKAWYWNNQYGITTYDSKTNSLPFLLVTDLSTPTTVNYLAAKTDISIYPNPSAGNLTVISEQSILKIECYNQVGEVVLTSAPQSNRANLTDLAPGFYLLRISHGETTTVCRILVTL